MDNIILNGVPFFDQNGNVVNAHGACIVYENGRYYLFGEYKTNDINVYRGFACYSTENLSDWTFEGMALAEDAGEMLYPNRVGERVKVIKSKKTGKYIMLMHTDDVNYNDPCIGMAVCDTINGSYRFVGPLMYNGKKIRKWDMGTFVDDDGTAYLLTHEGDIYRFNDECTEAVELVAKDIAKGGESPAMCKHNGIYYIMFSNKTSWERNDNYYLTADNIAGPWMYKGLFCPKNSRTYNTQCSYLFDFIKDGKTTKMYLGDRWSYPKQASAATLVILPLEFNNGVMEISRYRQMFYPDNPQKIVKPEVLECEFVSDKREDYKEITFTSDRLFLYGNLSDKGGYCKIEIIDENKEVIHTDMIDFYSAVPMDGLRYASPKFPMGTYKVHISPLGENGECFNKDGTRFGSSGCFVDIYGYSLGSLN